MIKIAKFKSIVLKEAKDANISVDFKDDSIYDLTFNQLGFDSMRVMNLLVDLEDEFDIYIPDEEFLEITIGKYIDKIN